MASAALRSVVACSAAEKSRRHGVCMVFTETVLEVVVVVVVV
jgi:hypothetical protein